MGGSKIWPKHTIVVGIILANERKLYFPNTLLQVHFLDLTTSLKIDRKVAEFLQVIWPTT